MGSPNCPVWGWSVPGDVWRTRGPKWHGAPWRVGLTFTHRLFQESEFIVRPRVGTRRGVIRGTRGSWSQRVLALRPRNGGRRPADRAAAHRHGEPCRRASTGTEQPVGRRDRPGAGERGRRRGRGRLAIWFGDHHRGADP